MLNFGPVGTAMVIPGCNEGEFGRGGYTGSPECREGDITNCGIGFRGCV